MLNWRISGDSPNVRTALSNYGFQYVRNLLILLHIDAGIRVSNSPCGWPANGIALPQQFSLISHAVGVPLLIPAWSQHFRAEYLPGDLEHALSTMRDAQALGEILDELRGDGGFGSVRYRLVR